MSKLIKKAFALVAATVSLGLFADPWNDDIIKVTDENVGENWEQEVGKTIVAIPAAAVTNNPAEADWTKRPTWTDKATIAQVGTAENPTNEFKITIFAPSGYKTHEHLKKGVKGSATVTVNGMGESVDSWEYSWTTNDFEFPSTKIPDDRFKKVLGVTIKPEWFNACVRTNSADYGVNKDFVDIAFAFKWNSETVARTWNLRLYADGVILPTEGTKEIGGMTLKNVGGFPEEYAALFDLTSQMPVLKPWEGGSQKDPEPEWQPAVTNFTILDTRDITLPENLTDTANYKFTGWTVAPTAATPIDPANVIARAEYAKEICENGLGQNNFTGVVFTASWQPFAWFVTTNDVTIGFTDHKGALALVNSLTNYTEGVTLSLNDNFYAPWKIAESEKKYIYEHNGWDDSIIIKKVSNVVIDLKGGEVASDYYDVSFHGGSGIVRNGKVCKVKAVNSAIGIDHGATLTLTNLVAESTKGYALDVIDRGSTLTLDSDVELHGADRVAEVKIYGKLIVPETAKNVYVTSKKGLAFETNAVVILRSGYFKGSSDNGKPFELIDEEGRPITVDFDCVTTNWVGALFDCNTLASWANCAKGMIPVNQEINGKSFLADDGTNYKYGFMAVPENATSSIDGSDPVTGDSVYAIANTTITNKVFGTYTKGEYEFAVKVTAPTNDGFKATIQKHFNIGAEPGVVAAIAGFGEETLDQLELEQAIYDLAEDGSFTWYVTTDHDQLRAAAMDGTVITNSISIYWDGQNGVTNRITVTIDPKTVVLWDEDTDKAAWPLASTITMCDEQGKPICADCGYSWSTNSATSWDGRPLVQDTMDYNELDAITNSVIEQGWFRVYDFADNKEKGQIFKGWNSKYVVSTNGTNVLVKPYIGEDIALTSSWANAWWYVKGTNGAVRTLCESYTAAYNASKENETLVLNTGHEFGNAYTNETETFYLKDGRTIDLNTGSAYAGTFDVQTGTATNVLTGGEMDVTTAMLMGSVLLPSNVTFKFSRTSSNRAAFTCFSRSRLIIPETATDVKVDISEGDLDNLFMVKGTYVALELKKGLFKLGEKSFVTYLRVDAYPLFTADCTGARFDKETTTIEAAALAAKILPYQYDDTLDYPYGFTEVGTDETVDYCGVASFTNETSDVYAVTVDAGATIKFTPASVCAKGLGKSDYEAGYFAKIAFTAPTGIQRDFNTAIKNSRCAYDGQDTNVSDIPGVTADGDFDVYVKVTPEQLREAAIASENITTQITNFWWDAERMTVVDVTIDPAETVLIAEDGTKAWPRDFAITVTNTYKSGWAKDNDGVLTKVFSTNILYYTELDAITNKNGIGSYRVYGLADRYGADDGCGGKTNYKFVGWDVGTTVVTNDEATGFTYLPANIATNAAFGAMWEKAPWTRLDANGATNGIYTTLADAYNAVTTANETLRLDAEVCLLTNWQEQHLEEGQYPVTIDLNGNTILAKRERGIASMIGTYNCAPIEIRNGVLVNEYSFRDSTGGATRSISADDTEVVFRDLSIFADQGIAACNCSSVVATNVTLTVPAGIEPGQEIGASLECCQQVAFTDVVIGENTSWSNSLGLVINGCGQVALNNTRVYGQDYASAVRIYDSAVTVNGGEYQSYEAATFSANNSSLTVTDGTVLTTFGVAASIGFAGADAEDVLTVGQATIDAEGNAISFKGGKLVTLPDSGLYARSSGDTLVIENGADAITVDPKNVCIWGGNFEVGDYYDIADGMETAERHLADFARSEVTDFRRALLSIASDPYEPIGKFLTAAPGSGSAEFSTIVDEDYAADGYQTADNGQVYPTSWFFVKADAYSISYDAADGVIREATVSSYAITNAVALPSNVTKAHYNFLGWKNEAGEEFLPGGIWNEGLDRTGAVKFTAQWGFDEYHLHVANRTAGTPREVTPAYTNIVMTDLRKVTIEKPVAKGYKFNYWESSDKARKYVPGEEYGIDDFKWDATGTNATITAVWTGSALVSIVTNDVVAAEYTNFKDALADLGKFKDGYLSVTSETGRFAIDETLLITNDNVTVELNGCTLEPSKSFVGDALVVISNATDSAVSGGILDGKLPESAGEIAAIRTFAGDEAAKSLGPDADLLFTVSVDEAYVEEGYKSDIVDQAKGLYGIVAKTYKLTFSAGEAGGRTFADFPAELNNAEAEYTCEGGLILVKDASRVCYDFAGWFDAKGSEVSGAFDPTGVKADTVLTARWTPHAYAISYELNQGSFQGASKPSYTCEDAAFTLATPVRAGYKFTGWCVNGAPAENPYTVDPQAMAAGAFGDMIAVAAWEADCYKITFNTLGGTAISELRYNQTLVDQGVVEIPVPEKAGSKFVNWVDENGSVIPTGKLTSCCYPETLNLTAVWEKSLWTGDSTVIGGNSQKPCTTFGGDVTYTGWLADKAGKIAGKVAVTAGKPGTKGSAITLTAGPVLGEGVTYTLKNTVAVTGEILTGVELKDAKSNTATVTISDNGVTGTFGDYEIVASADRFAKNVTKIPAAALAYLQGNWTVAFQSTNHCHGATTLKLAVAAKGKVTVTGNLGDGTAVSTTAQLIYGDGVCACPIVINAFKGKVGGFAFNLWFGTTGTGDNVEDETEITALSDVLDADGEVVCSADGIIPLVQRVSENVTQSAYVFKVDLSDFELPAGYELVSGGTTVEIAANVSTGKFTLPKASTVTVNATTGEPTWKNQNGNDLGLALTYTPSTGALTGSMKVYAKTQSKAGRLSLKTYTVKVYGVMTGKVALCAAVEKTIGSAPAGLAGSAE